MQVNSAGLQRKDIFWVSQNTFTNYDSFAERTRWSKPKSFPPTSADQVVMDEDIVKRKHQQKYAREMCHCCHFFAKLCLFTTLWIVAHQAPPSMAFPRQEYWNNLPFPSPRDLPYLGIEPALHLLHWQADFLPLSRQGSKRDYVIIINSESQRTQRISGCKQILATCSNKHLF